MATKTTKVSTTHEEFGTLSAEFEATQFESIEEAVEWYDGDTELLKAINADAATRQKNAARPALNSYEGDEPTEEQLVEIAQQAAESYRPGKRSSFGRAEVSAEDIQSLDSKEDLIALLRRSGVKIA